MKKVTLLILLFTSALVKAQNTATITLTNTKQGPATATVVQEDVHFHPNLGIGLADVKMESIAAADFKDKTS